MTGDAHQGGGIVDRMMTVMAERMANRMGPDQMQAMMVEMMGGLLADMDPAERIAFMRTMMEACIPKLTEGLSPDQRADVVSSIVTGIGVAPAVPPDAGDSDQPAGSTTGVRT
ncbi:MAG: hypothetical protein M0Z49_00510 [Chloroflexi bacterium]|nr:hypothetical protein [Chloroflexota bacterium]